MTSELNKLARFYLAKSIISNDIEAARVSSQYLIGLQRLPDANSVTYSYLFQRRRKSFTVLKNRFKRSSLTDRPTLIISDDVLLNKRSSLAPALRGVGKTTSLLSSHFRRIFIAIKWKNSGK